VILWRPLLILSGKECSGRESDTPVKHRAIFRESAVQRYIQRRDKDVLPRLLRPPVFLFLWILLGLGLLAGIIAWSIRVPVYTVAPGVILQGSAAGQLETLVFVPLDQRSTIRSGQPVLLQIGASGPHLQLTITSVVPQALSPAQIRARYALDNALALVVSQPAVVAVVTIQADASLKEYAGGLVSASIQIGTRSVLSFLPILDRLIGA
jgi:hypothetical protein